MKYRVVELEITSAYLLSLSRYLVGFRRARTQGGLAEQMGRENERLAARVRQYPPRSAALKRFKDPRLDNPTDPGESLDVLRNYLVARKPQAWSEGLMASIPSTTFARPSNLPLLLISLPRIVVNNT